MNSGNLSIIVVDDDADTRFAITRILKKCECNVIEAASVDQTLELLQHHTTDVIFSDVRMPGAAGGEELLAAVRQQYPSVQVVLMSCAMDDTLRAQLTDKGATACLQKPFYKDVCLELIEQLRNPLQKSA